MEDAKKQLVDKLKSANNILVTVSRDPSVDQLAALIGLTLILTKDDKHAAAVFSGKVPSTIEFLKPDETIEKNTDSLRDFIIALDKSKADKLRYKVEDNVVRIFITPYKTSITQDDFEFSQGDFNVDLVVALGVQRQEDLDEAIMAHGQILHNATVASVNVAAAGGLGTINWHKPQSSSLSEMVTEIGQDLGEKLLDEQISTALMTGIVAETDRFSNEKTSPETMSFSSKLMSAGANQQLVASKLMDAGQLATLNVQDTGEDASMEILHDDEVANQIQSPPRPAPVEPALAELPTFELPKPTIDSLPSEANLPQPTTPTTDTGTILTPGAKLLTEPPSMPTPGEVSPYDGEYDTANSNPYGLPPAEPPQLTGQDIAAPPPPTLSIPDTAPVAQPSAGSMPATDNATSAPPLPADPTVLAPDPTQPTEEVRTHQTLTQLEEAVASPHLAKTETTQTAGLDTARGQVTNALNESATAEPPKAQQSLNAVQFGQELHPSDLPTDPGPPPMAPAGTASPAQPGEEVEAQDPNAPPPVPPPIPFQFGNPPAQQ